MIHIYDGIFFNNLVESQQLTGKMASFWVDDVLR